MTLTSLWEQKEYWKEKARLDLNMGEIRSSRKNKLGSANWSLLRKKYDK